MKRSRRSIKLKLEDGQIVSALLQKCDRPRACLVLAHGAGAGMNHPFLATLANGLAERRVATLRFQFPFMERGSRRPDSPKIAHAAVRAAVEAARRKLPQVPLFAGGKSFGGRMTSQAQALEPMADVRGLVFFGFPLHPPKKPSIERAVHLSDVHVPMLFLQGTRDELAQLALLRRVCRKLRDRAELHLFRDADHSFHVRRKSGQTDETILNEMMDATVRWVTSV